MNKYKVNDANLARLINTFIKAKGFSYIAYVGDETFQINIYYKKYNFNICIYKDDKIYQNIVFRDDKYEMEIITILPTDSKILDGFGLAKGYHELCKLIGCDNELSSDETCLLDFNYEKDSSDGFSLRGEKKKVSRKMKPYYLAFKDISFKDVRSKVKSSESLIKKYFVISYLKNMITVEFKTAPRQTHLSTCLTREYLYKTISASLAFYKNYLIPVLEWKKTDEISVLRSFDTFSLPIQGSSNVGLKSIQVEPKQSISQFIDEIIPKNPNSFKHSNPRIINKKQLQNYVSEYNNDRDFYEYLSSNSSTQS